MADNVAGRRHDARATQAFAHSWRVCLFAGNVLLIAGSLLPGI